MAFDLNASLAAALQRLPADDTPFAIGFSGGGDSTALLYALREQAARIHVFIVDHGLREGSAAEARQAQLRAESWGFETELLTSYFGKLYAAIQEEARRFRYRLIAEAMRARGLSYLLTGHTLDDQAETCLMRYERKTDWRGAAGMGAQVYAPVWPELAGVTIMRPLLDVSRQELRAYNRENNLEWAEDPSNENRQFARIRARDELRDNPNLRALLLRTSKELQTGLQYEQLRIKRWLDDYAVQNASGWVTLRAVPSAQTLMYIIRAVAGRGRVVERAALRDLRQRMLSSEFKAATLGGAHINRTNNGFIAACDPVNAKGRRGQTPALQAAPVKQGYQIWDGRYSVEYTGRAPLTIQPLWGHIERVSEQQAERVKSMPASARPCLPLILTADNAIKAVGSHNDTELRLIWLGAQRLAKLNG